MDPIEKQAVKIVAYSLGLILIICSAVVLASLLGGVLGGVITASVCGLVLYLWGRRTGLRTPPGRNTGHSDDAESQDWLEQSGRRSVEVNDPRERRTHEIRENESPEEALRRLRGR